MLNCLFIYMYMYYTIIYQICNILYGMCYILKVNSEFTITYHVHHTTIYITAIYKTAAFKSGYHSNMISCHNNILRPYALHRPKGVATFQSHWNIQSHEIDIMLMVGNFSGNYFLLLHKFIINNFYPKLIIKVKTEIFIAACMHAPSETYSFIFSCQFISLPPGVFNLSLYRLDMMSVLLIQIVHVFKLDLGLVH